MQPDHPLPALRLGFDPDALRANWLTLDRLSGEARAGAAVKANAYGLGVAQVVPVLRDAGCRDFFVAHWSEVADVIAHVEPGLVSVLHGPLGVQDAGYARAVGVKPVINSLEQARRWHDAGGGPCDLMVDTGMNRLGLPLSQLNAAEIEGLDVDVLLSHLVSSEEADNPLNGAQREGWNKARGKVRHRRASLANSAGIMLGTDFHGDLTRPGIALYGGVPCPALESEIRQVVTPRAAILQVREVQAGETIGYNATFTAKRAMRTGTIAIGYADGYLRSWSGRGLFRAHGKTLPVLGRVSMDMSVIDLSDAPELAEGDWVDADYALAKGAQATGLTQYELLTLLGRRFARG